MDRQNDGFGLFSTKTLSVARLALFSCSSRINNFVIHKLLFHWSEGEPNSCLLGMGWVGVVKGLRGGSVSWYQKE